MHHRIAAASLFLLALVLSASCRSTQPAEAAGAGGAALRSLLRGYQSGIVAKGVRVARDAREWEALWKEHTRNVLPRPDAPDVDFSREIVVGAFLGQRPSGGYAIAITALRPDGGRLVVEATETRPAPDRLVPQVLSSPYHFVTTAKTWAEPVLELE